MNWWGLGRKWSYICLNGLRKTTYTSVRTAMSLPSLEHYRWAYPLGTNTATASGVEGTQCKLRNRPRLFSTGHPDKEMTLRPQLFLATHYDCHLSLDTSGYIIIGRTEVLNRLTIYLSRFSLSISWHKAIADHKFKTALFIRHLLQLERIASSGMLQLGTDSEILSLELYFRDRSITLPLPDSEIIDTGLFWR